MDYSSIKGFNYQPSYGSNGFEIWRQFDATVVDRELGAGKRYFPGMNAIRLWLSWDAFNREPERFAQAFDTALATAQSYDLVVMPVLFNRWHDRALDYGGIYIDHFLSRVSWVQREHMFDRYMEMIVGRHAADPRVFAWDLCNEPFSYSCPPEEIPEIVDAELSWLEGLYKTCKRLNATAPVTVGIHPGHGRRGMEQVAPISDILSIHPYWTADSPAHDKGVYEKSLDDYVAVAARLNKPLLATETCWGALDDAKRVSIITYTLGELKKRNIGWLVYLLHHSLIADAHRPEYGPVTDPGNLAFIEADDSLRPGHGVFNEF
ncbi:MAG: cellulase family glycosylhydrolase [Chloroflexi bacterium]|nr:cellulase family glycosylhydrolase [Chloroflexota bacterium]